MYLQLHWKEVIRLASIPGRLKERAHSQEPLDTDMKEDSDWLLCLANRVRPVEYGLGGD